jgi:hypothetical protein
VAGFLETFMDAPAVDAKGLCLSFDGAES